MGKKSDNQWKDQAAKAATRIDEQRAAGHQLGLFPISDDEPPMPVEADGGGVGRPKGSKNKNSSQVREWMSARGIKMPETVLAEIMGSAQGMDATIAAMAKTEQLLGWAYEAGTVPKGGNRHPSPHQFIETFKYFYASSLRAADALLPYVAPKATPAEVGDRPAVHIHMPPQPGQGAPKDVTPQPKAADVEPWLRAAKRDGRISEDQQKQQLSKTQNAEGESDRRSIPKSEGNSDG